MKIDVGIAVFHHQGRKFTQKVPYPFNPFFYVAKMPPMESFSSVSGPNSDSAPTDYIIEKGEFRLKDETKGWMEERSETIIVHLPIGYYYEEKRVPTKNVATKNKTR